MISFIEHVLAQMRHERKYGFGFLPSANMSNRPEAFGGIGRAKAEGRISQCSFRFLFKCQARALYSMI